MSAFWETFTEANAAAMDVMGETARLDELETQVMVDSVSYEEGKSAGGRKAIVNARIMVPAGTVLRDGMPVHLRGADGKVTSWEALAPDGQFWVNVGPVNRWSGEVPGL